MKVTIISIGDELLIGQVVNTLAADMAPILATAGWTIDRVLTVGDSADAIRNAVTDAMAATDVVITTGGLGPTRDDITKSVLAEMFGGELVEDPATLDNVREVVGKRGLKLNTLTARQAIVPSCCRVIQNRVGTAPIMVFEKNGKTLVAMPGVPFETLTMLRDAVLPSLLEAYPATESFERATIIVTGYTESALAIALAPVEDTLPPFVHLAYLPRPGLVRLRLDGHHADAAELAAAISESRQRIVDLLGPSVKATDDLSPAEILLEECRRRDLRIAAAESCTGGRIASALTAVPGSSEVFNGGIVAYSNSAKMHLLHVGESTLATHGAVSLATVEEMAKGALDALDADVAMATSGIAGPGGAVPGKPVGTVAIAVALRASGAVVSAMHHFPGSRERVADRATMTALIAAVDAVTGCCSGEHGYR